jgi:hypothetical protein
MYVYSAAILLDMDVPFLTHTRGKKKIDLIA